MNPASEPKVVNVTTNPYYKVPEFKSLADVDEFFKAIAENKIVPAGSYTLIEYADDENIPAKVRV